MELQDLIAVGFLVFMEGVLSIDNALVLAMMVRHLPEKERKRALTYGIYGAFGFRVLSLFLLNLLMKSAWIKIVGGGYLLYLAGKHFLTGDDQEEGVGTGAAKAFWGTVLTVELMDIAFSVDSILASVAVSPKLWVVATGGVLGIIMMRFAASLFVKLLEKFPGFETTAYVLITIIGGKLALEGFQISGLDFHHGAAMWTFWALMACGVATGFLPAKENVPEEVLEEEQKVMST
jgi:YkoY family integral membrane protein